MRRLYREKILEKLRQGEVGWVVRQASRYLGIRLAPLLGKPLSGPLLGTLITNYSCNLRCVMCDLPLRVSRYGKEGLQPLSTEETLSLIDDFARIGTSGLGFTGGEPMMRKDLFELLARSKRRGMITHLNTNGTFLDREAATRLIHLGVDSVNLSLDGTTESTHDGIRGQKGSFREVVEAARNLEEARKEHPQSRLKLKLVLVLSRDNLAEARSLLDMRRELGADSVDYIPVHDFDQPGSTRSRPGQGKTKLASPGEPDASFLREIDDLLADLAARKATDPIDNSLLHLELMRLAFRHRANPTRCSAGFNSCVVDLYGRIFPCVPWSNADRPVGDVRETPLPSFWRSAAYNAQRESVNRCQDCYLNCHSELNLVFHRPKLAPEMFD